MGFKDKIIDKGRAPHTYWVFGARIRWSHFWWFAVIPLVLAVLALVVPIDAEKGRSASCGSAFSDTITYFDGDGDTSSTREIHEDSKCDKLQDARSNRALAWAIIALIPMWLGRRDIDHGDVRRAHVGAAVCIGVCLMLLIGPHESSTEWPCGSPLFVTADERSAIDAESCVMERPSRVSWAVLWGVAAIPFAMAAARSRKD